MQTSKLQNGILFIVLQFSSSYLFTYLVIYVVLSLYIYSSIYLLFISIFFHLLFLSELHISVVSSTPFLMDTTPTVSH